MFQVDFLYQASLQPIHLPNRFVNLPFLVLVLGSKLRCQPPKELCRRAREMRSMVECYLSAHESRTTLLNAILVNQRA